ncbi:MAG: hypothetical protein HY587_04945 [Candidatus Omnitrophica bacterium]|nr:hypothetical protein [Candidatus Omnitrophota bacterium]
MNHGKQKVLLIAAGILFVILSFWTWKLVFTSGGLRAIGGDGSKTAEVELPPLKQNVVFTRLPVDTSLSDDPLSNKKKRWEDALAQQAEDEAKYGPDGKRLAPPILD